MQKLKIGDELVVTSRFPLFFHKQKKSRVVVVGEKFMVHYSSDHEEMVDLEDSAGNIARECDIRWIMKSMRLSKPRCAHNLTKIFEI